MNVNSLFNQRWNQLVLFGAWFLSLVFLYAYMDSRLTKVHREYAYIWRETRKLRDGINLSNNFGDQNLRASRTVNEENLVVIYNRVPKTASTSFMGVTYDLCKKNGFSAIHLNISRNIHTMNLADQWTFVKNVSNWVQRKPAIYHGHVAFIDFHKFGQRNPVYINLVRDPLERLISYYYFLRYGDNFRPHLVRRRQGDTETFNECIERGGKDCDPSQMWVQIPFFCGHAAECWVPGSRLALEQAKYNLMNHYLLVGVTEELRDFLAILEVSLPRFFTGAIEMYNSGHKSNLRKTNKKIAPSQATLKKIQEWRIWQMENEFFEFAKQQFHFVRDRTLRFGQNGEVLLQNPPEFHYEKIKPNI